MSEPRDKNRERFTFALFLATAFHSAIIFGVTFDFEPEPQGKSLLDVTITLNTSAESPDEADFIANDNSIGSGTEDAAKELTTAHAAAVEGSKVDNSAEPQIEMQQGRVATSGLVTTTASTNITAPTDDSDIEVEANDDLDQEQVLANEIAALKAKLAKQQQLYSKRPRIKRLSSMSARAAIEAQYLSEWQSHVEEIGNLNYPEEARTQRLYGELRMLVSMLPDGKLYDAKILQSSGNRVLDRAALDIVELAAPFPRFDSKLSAEYDRLEVIRTWRFERGNRLSNH